MEEQQFHRWIIGAGGIRNVVLKITLGLRLPSQRRARKFARNGSDLNLTRCLQLSLLNTWISWMMLFWTTISFKTVLLLPHLPGLCTFARVEKYRWILTWIKVVLSFKFAGNLFRSKQPNFWKIFWRVSEPLGVTSYDSVNREQDMKAEQEIVRLHKSIRQLSCKFEQDTVIRT